MHPFRRCRVNRIVNSIITAIVPAFMLAGLVSGISAAPADTVRAKIVSMTPGQKTVQGAGKLQRTITVSVPLDSGAAATATLGDIPLTAGIDGADKIVLTGDIPASAKNGKVALAVKGLVSKGKPVVLSGLPAISIDTEPPKLDAAVVLINGSNAKLFKDDSLTVVLSKAINSADVASATVAVDGGTPVETTTGKATLTGVPEGAHRLVIIVRDKAGNPSPAVEVPVTVDRTPPDISKAVLSVSGGKTIVSSPKTMVKVAGITDNNGIKTVFSRIGTAPPQRLTADSFAVQIGRDGTDTVAVWAEDSAGNVSQQLRTTITRDTKAPTAEVTVDKLWKAGAHAARWAFNESMDTTASAVTKLDETAVTARWTSPTVLSATITVTEAFGEGNRQLTLVSAQDLAGNSCAPVNSTVMVDTRAPKLTDKNVVLNMGNRSVSCDSASLTVEDITDPSGIAEYQYILDGGTAQRSAGAQMMLRKLKDGNHKVSVTVTDAAGNTSKPVEVAFNVDASRPGVKRSFAGPCDKTALRIPLTIIFTKAMDAGELPKLSVDKGALDGAAWTDTVTLTCRYDPEAKGAVDTVRIGIKGGRDRGGFPLVESEAVCPIGTDTAFALAKAHAAAGSHNKAAGLLERLSNAQPYLANIAESWANEARADKDRNGERAAMERLAKLRPADKKLLRALVNLTSKMGDRKASKAWMKQLMVADGKMEAVSTADYRKEGRSFFRMDPGACLVPADGSEAATLCAEGAAAVQTGDYGAAREAFISALTLDSSCIEAVYNLATLKMLEGKPLKAEADLARCTSVNNRFAGNYAVAMAMSGKLKEALEMFSERKISLEDPALAGVYGVLLIRSGKTFDALPHLEKASQTGTPQRINYAFGLYTAKQYDRALAMFQTCGAAATDTFPEIFYGKALAELQLGDKDAAVSDLQAAVAIQPVYLDAQLKLGELLMKRKDPAGAKHALSFAVRADSTSSAAHQALAAMYRETGETDKAREQSMIAALPPKKDENAMTVGVEQFKNVTRDSSVQWLAVGMAEAVTTEMNRFSPYRMLERMQIENLMKRRALKQATGEATTSDDAEIGKMLGAKGLVTGSYQSVGTNLRIDGRLVEVETGSIMQTASATGTMNDLARMQRMIALTLSGRADALELAELGDGVSADAQERMALAKKALYSGNAEEAKKLADEALLIDPSALSLAGSMAIAMANEGRGKSMAVIEFENLSGVASDAGMGPGIQEALITNLRKTGKLSIVERSQIDKLCNEIGLAQTGLVKENSAASVGGMLAAGVLLTGGYQTSGNNIRITAKLLDAVTAEVLLAADVSGKKNDLFELEDQLSVRILKALQGTPAVDSSEIIDPTLKRGADTATAALEEDSEEEEAKPGASYDGREETLARRLSFYVTPAIINMRLTGLVSFDGDVGFHFLNQIFAVDGMFEISMDNIMRNVFDKSFFAGKNDPSSIDILYRAFEAGAGWNFWGRWNDDETGVSFYQLRAGYKSEHLPEFTVRTDTIPPYLGGTVYAEDEERLTLNATEGTIYAGLAVARKSAEGRSRKTFRLYTDFLWAPYLKYEPTDNDGDPYDGLYHAVWLQRAGVRLGMEKTRNGRFGLRWLLETGLRPGIHSANEPTWLNMYFIAKIGVCSSWY